ncbi:hypothetical protein LWI29_034783 [Acer saccharum]|uniref:Uncharacterized protein n=1 Tax=Acer saccharum TaxID=4024 RepID=A0AA39VJU7_ACESA|nr:hypothetical protein LWI29_034783 [Acer saccharum]
MQVATCKEEGLLSHIPKWEFTQRTSSQKPLRIFTAQMFAEAELRPTDEELGQWYYEGIDDGGCLYPNPDSAETFDSSSPSSHPTPVRSTHVPSLPDMDDGYGCRNTRGI